MVNNMIKKLFLPLVILALLLITSCGEKKEHPATKNRKDTVNNGNNQTGNGNLVFIESPKYNEMFSPGDQIKIKVSLSDKNQKIDSASLFIDNEKVTTSALPFEYTWDSKNQKPGKKKIQVKYLNGSKEEAGESQLQIKSEIKPVEYTYTVVNTYPHDITAYSQGLFYDNGVLYEGTGQYGESTIRKVELKTGKVLTSFNMPNSIFGEGITILGNKIYQLSWQSGKGYVYDKESFKILQEFEYDTEGWGITSDDKKLFMTDGSNKIYLMDKNTFAVTGTLEVYNNNGPVANLNELEYIKGSIYANVYLTDYIVIIDPETGKITGRIDMKGLLSRVKVTHKVDVLNGIAWDPKGDRLFVTGKWWPALFEVKLVEK